MRSDRTVLRLALGWACAAFFCASAVHSADRTTATSDAGYRPNVLMIVADDLNTRLGCYGDPIARTPNIDRLAARSMRFERAYCQYPVCNPSRVSMLTGRYPSGTNVTDNRSWFRHFVPDIVALPQQFRKQDYLTIRCGKIFHDTANDELGDPVSWTFNAVSISMPDDESTLLKPDAVGGFEVERGGLDARRDLRYDENNVERTAVCLKQLARTPFLICSGIKKPHAPYVAPRAYLEPFQAADVAARIQLPPDYANRPLYRADVERFAWRENIDVFRGRESTPAEALQAIQAYYACVAYADSLVGRILDALEASGLADDTIVIFVGDNGEHLGEKGLWGKMSLYDPALHVPLMISVPESVRTKLNLPSGQYVGACPRTVQLVDLYPTLCQLCGLAVDEALDGHSLTPLLCDPQAAWEHPAYATMFNRRGRTVRTEEYRYTVWDDGAMDELFDYGSDPHEMRNCTGDPAYAEVRRNLLSFLKERRQLEGQQRTPWTLSAVEGSRAVMDPPHGGGEDIAVEVSAAGTGKPWQVQLKRGWCPVQAGKQYRLRFTARANRPRPIGASLSQSVPPYNRVGATAEFELNEEWANFEYVYKSQRMAAQALLVFDLGQAPGRVEVRQVFVEPVEATAAATGG